MKLVIFLTILALSSAAQIPSKYNVPPNLDGSGLQSLAGTSGNRRPQQEAERNSAILKQDQEISETGDYHFGFETSNGIRAEESGSITQARGGFSYKGDDGNTYTVIYSSGEDGFRAQGEHLPVPPPTPQEILLALQQNEKDEAAGIFDDGQYHPDGRGPSSGSHRSFH